MKKITFMGAGSTIFVKNVIGDCMCSEILNDSTFCLYDIEDFVDTQSYYETLHEVSERDIERILGEKTCKLK